MNYSLAVNLFSGMRNFVFRRFLRSFQAANYSCFKIWKQLLRCWYGWGQKTQMKLYLRMDPPYLAPVGNREYPSGATTLLHIPQEPQGRHLVGLRGHIDIHKERCKLLSSPGHRIRADVRGKHIHASQDIIFLKHNLVWVENISMAFQRNP